MLLSRSSILFTCITCDKMLMTTLDHVQHDVYNCSGYSLRGRPMYTHIYISLWKCVHVNYINNILQRWVFIGYNHVMNWHMYMSVIIIMVSFIIIKTSITNYMSKSISYQNTWVSWKKKVSNISDVHYYTVIVCDIH